MGRRLTGLPLAQTLAALSLATDLGAGLPPETALRTCRVATSLAQCLGLRGQILRTVYYGGLLRHLGCTAWAHEAHHLYGDDRDLIAAMEGVDHGNRLSTAQRVVARLARGEAASKRVRAVASALVRPGAARELMAAQCAQARELAQDIGLGEVGETLAQMYERHDGRGAPLGLRGESIGVVARIIHAAYVVESLHRQLGPSSALTELRRRKGTQLAPTVCQAAIDNAARIWQLLETPHAFEAVVDDEPEPRLYWPAERMADLATTFGRFSDLQSAFTVGHSTTVAQLAARAGELAGQTAHQVAELRIAALLHDIGSVSVGNRVWHQPGALGTAQWELVRLHAYHGERILQRTSATAPYAALVAAHHERIDGSGYHRGARGGALAGGARLLAAADVYVALSSDRPHRQRVSDPAAELVAEATAGRLCRDAVALVLEAAGHPRPRVAPPGGLTERECEVLALVARGLSSKEIATALGIAARTAKHHIEHIHEKTGVTSRAAAALLAARHDLVRP